MSNFLIFANTYRENLKRLLAEKPESFAFPASEANIVADKMIVAFDKGTYNKDGLAIIATCKALKIKHTYKAINEYINIKAP